MLSVTNSEYPGTIKDLYSWYDYEAFFDAKIIKKKKCPTPNFSFVIRSDNNLNGLLFKVGLKKIEPYFLYNGTYIADDRGVIELPRILQTNYWHKVIIKVEGNMVTINIDEYKTYYNIKTIVVPWVEDKLMKHANNLSEIYENNKKLDEIFDKYVNDHEKMTKMSDGPDKVKESLRLNEVIRDFPTTTKVVLDYPKGSFGFRESKKEKAYFRKLIIKKIRNT